MNDYRITVTDVEAEKKEKELRMTCILVGILLLCIALIIWQAVSDKRQTVSTTEIEQAIIEELKLQATDYGVDGDEYVVFLFPATSAYTEVTEEGGRLYLAYIIGSGTDDEGEWQLVKYEPGGNISTFDIP